tara:strand:- start:113 stop:583 length:471 start_codon:yes stop_codon:yes gene_type:complete
MKPITAYKATDGKIFEGKEEAKNYEFSRQFDERIEKFIKSGKAPYAGIQQKMMTKSIIAWEKFLCADDGVTENHTPISGMFSIRAANCLSSECIDTVEQLVTWSEESLLKVHNLGHLTMSEIKGCLAERGLCLAHRSAETRLTGPVTVRRLVGKEG